MTQRCEYVFTGDSTDEKDVSEGWECPHEVAEVSDSYCLFHLTEDEQEEVDDETVADAFLDLVSSPRRESKRFIGARIQTLNVNFQRVDAPDNHPIDLRFATIEEFQANYSHFEQPLLLSDSDIFEFNCKQSKFNNLCAIESASLSSFDCTRARFNGQLSIQDTEVDFGWFQDAVFQKGIRARNSEFTIGARFKSTTFDGPADFERAYFNSPYTNLEGQDSKSAMQMQRNLSIRPLFTGQMVVAPEHWVDDPMFDADHYDDERFYFSEREFVDENYVHFNDSSLNGADFRFADFASRAIFDSTNFDYADFGNAEFSNQASFVDSQIFGAIYFNAVYFDSVEMRFLPEDTGVVYNENSDSRTIDLRNKGRVYLTESTIERGHVRQPSEGEVYYDVGRARLGDVDIISDDNSFQHLLVRKTEFDGFDFTEYRDDLEAINWEIDKNDVIDPLLPIPQDKSIREITYLKAKQGAAQVGDTIAESEFFQREMNFRTFRYSIDPHSTDPIWVELSRVANALRHIIGNQLYRVTCGYGEKPSKVFISYTALVVCLSAFLMFPYLALGEPDLFIRGVIQVGKMLTFGQTGTVPGWFAGLVGLFQTFIIPTYIALLVFTLSRSIDR